MNATEFAELIPHQAPMVLVETLEHWDPEAIECTSASHHTTDNPLRIDGALSVFAGIEYAAQAMAAHARLCSAGERAPQRGYIAVASKVRAHTDRLDADPGELRVRAQRLTENDASSLYAFSVSSPERRLLEGQLTVIRESL